jgi:co-chaperonin GroES (HSP10)
VIPLKPIGGRVMVKPLRPTKELDSGIVLVEDAVPETMGQVLAVSDTADPDVARLREALSIAATICPDAEQARAWSEIVSETAPRTPDVAVGDVVLFSWQAGQEVLLDGERVLLLAESDLLATVEQEDR